MKFLVLLVILFSVRNAPCQYVLNMKNDFWNGYSPDVVCLNKGRDSLTLVLKEERMNIPIDTVGFLSYREHKSWWPYLLTAAIVGGSTYTYFHFTSRDDAMFTAEGKARFGGIFWGGIVLGFGAMMKEMVETRFIIHTRLGINDAEALLTCSF
jgi:hypothetical protein